MSSAGVPSSLSKKGMPEQLKYSIPVFLFLMFRLLMYTYNRSVVFSSVVGVYYTLSYELGFIPRAFIGTILGLFTDYLTNDALRLFIHLVTVLLLAVIAVSVGRVISKTSSEYRPAVLLFLFFLLTAPLSHTYFIERHFGRLDTFWILFTLLSLLCLKNRYTRWLIPVLCFAAVATHPGFSVTYMPALLVPLFYEVYRGRYSSSGIVLFSVCCTVLLSSFVYFQFLAVSVPFADAESFGAYLSSRTDMKISVPVLYLEYISPHLDRLTNPNTFTDLMLPMLRDTALRTVLAFLGFTLPLILIFAAVWKSGFRHADNNHIKLVFILCALSPLAFIPAALFGQDWERWWAAAINVQFILIFYFAARGDTALLTALKTVYAFFMNHLLVLLCILLFAGTLLFSDICSFILNIFDKSIWLDFFASVLENFDYTV